MIHKERNKFYPVESSWGYTRLKNIADYITRGNSPTYDSEGNIQVVNQACINGYEVSLEHIKVHKDDDISLLKGRLQRGDLLMNSTGTGTLGRTAIFNHEGDNFIADSHITIIRDSHKRFIPKYLHYYFNDKQEMLTERCSRGATNQIEIQRKELITLLVPSPLKVIQERITAFLDKACAAIYGAIRTKQQQLEVLDQLRKSIIHKAVTRGLDEKASLKYSGIQWIGAIPEHWRIEKLKRLLAEPLMYGTNEAAELDDPDLPRYIRITDFEENGKLREDTFRSLPLDKAQGYYLSEDDLLFARSGATVGKSFMFKNYVGAACFAGYLIKARTDHRRLNPEFLYYYTKSPCYEAWKEQIFTQATIQNISATKYAYLPVVLPPLKEQRQIVGFLEEKLSELEQLGVNIFAQITALEQYRKSLIHECVTGKRRIE